MPLPVTLDRRATFTVAGRTAQFAAAERVKALFKRMSLLVTQIASVRAGAAAASEKLAPTDPLRGDMTQLSDRANTLRKLVVATTEGGAITGEVRLRENMADAYGAITATEAAPAPYVLDRVDALERELTDVEGQFAKLSGTELKGINSKLKAKSLPPLSVAVALPPEPTARGGRLASLFQGMVGLRYVGVAAESRGVAGDER